MNDITEQDPEALAVRLAEALELSNAGEKREALEAFVEGLGPESIAILEDAMNIII